VGRGERARRAVRGAAPQETFGTSGPRITVRFFGGWDYAEDLCAAPDLAARGYAGGVPMGGDLTAPPPGAGARGPRFAVSARRDPGGPGGAGAAGTRLERVQIVKGWLSTDGKTHERVFDVARAPGEADVDLATCAPRGAGADSLCAVWTDPLRPGRARVLVRARAGESHLPLDDARLQRRRRALRGSGHGGRGFEACCAPEVPRTIQERAWTSPIWYSP
jgi:hypothetical protein